MKGRHKNNIHLEQCSPILPQLLSLATHFSHKKKNPLEVVNCWLQHSIPEILTVADYV